MDCRSRPAWLDFCWVEIDSRGRDLRALPSSQVIARAKLWNAKSNIEHQKVDGARCHTGYIERAPARNIISHGWLLGQPSGAWYQTRAMHEFIAFGWLSVDRGLCSAWVAGERIWRKASVDKRPHGPRPQVKWIHGRQACRARIPRHSWETIISWADNDGAVNALWGDGLGNEPALTKLNWCYRAGAFRPNGVGRPNQHILHF